MADSFLPLRWGRRRRATREKTLAGEAPAGSERLERSSGEGKAQAAVPAALPGPLDDIGASELARQPWHAISAAAALQALRSEADGLSAGEAARRLTVYGPNRLTPPKRRGPLARFLLQFHSVLIYVLLAAAVITALLGKWVDSAVIAGVVLINAVIGFVQEGKAERALAAIREMLSLEARVIRDACRRVVAADKLVPGDIVLLQSGDKVPADLRLIETKSLRIQEAALTGESVAVEKNVLPVAANAALGDRSSMAYAGTLVVSGQAKGIVVATGDATEIGKVGTLLGEVETIETPLLRQMAGFARQLTLIILALAGLTFAFGLMFRAYGADDMFLAAVGIAVAAIPEGLPAIMTITLALGVQRMARRNAIVRRLPAVEALGSVTLICTDKTGTLTRNEMTAQRAVTPDGSFAIGSGDPVGGEPTPGDRANLSNASLQALFRAAVLCNDADLELVDDAWRIDGDPTEGALLIAGHGTGLDHRVERRTWPRLDHIPFESEYRFMATLHRDPIGRHWIFLKGAPEVVLPRCRCEAAADERPLDLRVWREHADQLAAKGQRLLALAVKKVPTDCRSVEFADVSDGFALLGLVGMIDPPRPEAIAAVSACRSAGVRVKMITGDHAITARAIAEQLGLANPHEVATGTELDACPDERFAEIAARVDVFARTSPVHKLRLVEALQAAGEITAMTGDGVNDAPALKRADVGIAMGQKGTEAAKEAAEIVLADDNFASIAAAIEEGRKVYDNIKKSILFILPTNAAQALIIMIAVVFGFSLPITPVQILWINMITSVTLGLALAFEPAEPDVMARPPRRPDESLLSRFLLWRIGFVALLLVIGTFGLFIYALTRGLAIEEARTVAVNMLVLFEVVYLLNCRRALAHAFSLDALFGNRAVLIAIGLVLAFQVLFTYTAPMQLLFGSAALTGLEWLWMALAALVVFLLVEIEKAWQRRAGIESRPASRFDVQRLGPS